MAYSDKRSSLLKCGVKKCLMSLVRCLLQPLFTLEHRQSLEPISKNLSFSVDDYDAKKLDRFFQTNIFSIVLQLF